MNCPTCGKPMRFLENRGYNWQNQPVHKWRCIGKSVPGMAHDHWVEIWVPERPWSIQLYRLGLGCAYLEKYGDLPFESQPLPEDYALQPRLF